MEQYNRKLLRTFGQHEYMNEPCSDCERCLALVKSRKQVTYGYGKIPSKIMFVGEAPGQVGCNITGMPFTRDRSGRYFQQCLQQARFNFEEIYTTNICKCSPPGNRNPEDKEIENCLPYLINEIDMVEPEIIVCLGRVASKVFLNTNRFSVIADRGSMQDAGVEWYKGKIIIMPHPAYILRGGAVESKLYMEEFKLIFNMWLSARKIDTKITDERWEL